MKMKFAAVGKFSLVTFCLIVLINIFFQLKNWPSSLNLLLIHEGSSASNNGSFNSISQSVKKNVKYILLLCTMGRSGSSWIGEMLSHIPRSLYMFEPGLYYEITVNQSLNAERGAKVLTNLLSCKFERRFIAWARRISKKHSNLFKSNNISQCTDIKTCWNYQKITSTCKKSEAVIIKSIRFRVENVRRILNYLGPENLKVLFLVRDPRAVLQSRNRLGWSAKPREKCQVLQSDLRAFTQLKTKYPTSFKILRYEDFSRNTKEEASRLWSFLQDEEVNGLSEEWTAYLSRKPDKKKNPYSVKQNSSIEWFAWRKEIPKNNNFNLLEKSCKDILSLLGYNLFGSVQNARNLSYSSLKPLEQCPHLPCNRQLSLS